jgi:hypothetical protein
MPLETRLEKIFKNIGSFKLGRFLPLQMWGYHPCPTDRVSQDFCKFLAVGGQHAFAPRNTQEFDAPMLATQFK